MQVLRQEDGDGCGGGKPSIIYKLLHFLIYLRPNFITFLQLNANYEAVKHVDCSTVKQTYLDGFNADAALESFLTSSTLGLQVTNQNAGAGHVTAYSSLIGCRPPPGRTTTRSSGPTSATRTGSSTLPRYRHASRY